MRGHAGSNGGGVRVRGAAGSEVLPRIGARSAPPHTISLIIDAWLKDRSTSIALAGFIPAGEAAVKLALDGRLIHTEAEALLASALVYPATRRVAIAWMARHFDELKRGFPRERWPFLLEMMGRSCEEESIAAVDAWSTGRRRTSSVGGRSDARSRRRRACAWPTRSVCPPTCTHSPERSRSRSERRGGKKVRICQCRPSSTASRRWMSCAR